MADDDELLGGESPEDFSHIMYVAPGPADDYGGEVVEALETIVGGGIAAGDYISSGGTSLDSLGNIPLGDDDNPAEAYTDTYGN